MKKLGKRISDVSKAEPRSLLPSSTDVTRGSALGFKDEAPIELLIEELANIIVKVYLSQENNDK